MAQGNTGSQSASGPSEYDRFIDQQLRRTRRRVWSVDLIGALLGVVVGALAWLAVMVLADHWLFTGGLGYRGRLVGLGVLFVGMVVFGVRSFAPLVLRRINPLYAAAAIEHSRPGLKNSLINLLMLRSHQDNVPQVVYHAIEQRAAQDLSSVPIETTVDRSRLIRLGYVLLAVVALSALYKVLSPKDPIRSVERVLVPWAELAAPTRVAITDIEPGSIERYYDDRLPISAHVMGLKGDESVTLFYSTRDGQLVDRPVKMNAPEQGFRWTAELPDSAGGLQQDLDYWIKAGDATTPRYRVSVLTVPSIAVESVEYKYPAYTELPPRTVERQGDLRALEGTQVTLHARATHDIRSAHVDFDRDGRRDLAMRATGHNAIVAFTLELKPKSDQPEHPNYQLLFTNTDGNDNPRPIEHRIEVVRDLPPEIAFVDEKSSSAMRTTSADEKPGDEQTLDARGVLPMKVEASDPDFRLASVVIVAERNGKPLVREELLAKPRSGRFQSNWLFDAKKYSLKPGDRVEYWAVATDNKQPEANRTETRRYTLRIASLADKKDDKKQDQLADARQRKQEGSGQQAQGSQKQEAGEQKQQQPGEKQQPEQREPGDNRGENGQQQPGQQAGSDAKQGDNDAKQGDNGDGGNAQQRRVDPDSDPGDAIEKINQHFDEKQQAGSEKGEREQGAGNDKREQQQPSGEQQQGNRSQGSQQQGNKQGSQQQGNQQQGTQSQGNQQQGSQAQSQNQQGGSQQRDSQQGNDAKNSASAGQDDKQPLTGRKSGEQGSADPNARGKEEVGGGQKADGSESGKQEGRSQKQDAASGKQEAGSAKQEAGKTEQGAGKGEQKDGRAQSRDAQPSGAQQQGDRGGGQSGQGEDNKKGSGTNDVNKNDGGSIKPGETGGDKGQATEGSQPRPDDKAAGDKTTKPGDGGQADTAIKKPGEEPSKEPSATPQGKKEEDRGGTEGENANTAQSSGGAGQSSGEKKANPAAQQENSPRDKKPGSEQSGANSSKEGNDASSPARDKQDSNAQGQTSGDVKGGGNDGGGQRASKPGTGGPGENTSAEEGEGKSQEKGSGEKSDRGGDQAQAGKRTEGGKAGDQAGEGSSSREGGTEEGRGQKAAGSEKQEAGSGKQEAGDKKREVGSKEQAPPGGVSNNSPQQPQTGNENADGAKGNQQNSGVSKPGERSDSLTGQGNPAAGGTPNNRAGAPLEPEPSSEPGGEDPNLEYARQATDLALERLKDQVKKGQPDQALLDKLKWTKDDLRRFIDRWDQMKQQAHEPGDAGKQAREDLDRRLRNLGLHPHGTTLGANAANDDRTRNMRQTRRSAPPPEYADQYRAYTTGTSRAKEE